MTRTLLSSMPLVLAAMALAGFIFGLFYFWALHRTAALFVAHRGWLWPAALTVGRIVSVALFLALIAKLGAAYLLAAFCGLLFARTVALWQAREEY